MPARPAPTVQDDRATRGKQISQCRYTRGSAKLEPPNAGNHASDGERVQRHCRGLGWFSARETVAPASPRYRDAGPSTATEAQLSPIPANLADSRSNEPSRSLAERWRHEPENGYRRTGQWADWLNGHTTTARAGEPTHWRAIVAITGTLERLRH